MYLDQDFFLNFSENLIATVHETANRNGELLIWEAIKKFIISNSSTFATMCDENSCDMEGVNYFIVSLMDVLNKFKFSKKNMRGGYRAFITMIIDLITVYRLEMRDYTTFLVRAKSEMLSITLNKNSSFCKLEKMPVIASLRGDFKFMKILLNYGMIEGVTGESTFMQYETRNIIREFM